MTTDIPVRTDQFHRAKFASNFYKIKKSVEFQRFFLFSKNVQARMLVTKKFKAEPFKNVVDKQEPSSLFCHHHASESFLGKTQIIFM